MRNLKKTLAVVLAFAMVLSMGFSAFAYTDVAEGTKVSEAVDVLSNLNILTGFEDGTFKPEETVTRAQMAAIICRTLGYEDQAKSSMGSTVFNDVAADHWAAGYINVAQSLQIINGYGDGNFGPEDQVTYEQAVKMIVVALGYELDAQAKGGYPTGYLAVASREGITKGANGLVGSAAVRGTIAVLVYNSLEVRLMDQSTWTTTGNEDEFTKQNDTILSKYLEVQKWEGIVEATPYSKMVTPGYKPETEAAFDLDTTSSIYREWASNELVVYGYGPQAKSPAYAPTNVKCGDIDVNTLAGKKVVAYIGEDAVTGEKILYAIAEKQGANTEMTIGLDQLDESGDKYYTEDGVIGYKAIGSTKSTDITLDDTVIVAKNFETVGTWTGSAKDTADLVGAVGTTGTVTFIDNDGDNKINVISAIAYDREAVVKSVSEEDGIITLETYVNNGNGVDEDIDTEDDKTLIIVYKDGALADVKAIAANDTISGAKISKNNNTFFIYNVSSKTVTGMVEAYDTYAKTVTIAGEDYKLASGSVASYKNKEGIFFVNTANKIVYADADVAAGNYALVLAAGAGSGVKGGFEVEVVLSDGNSAVYPLHSDAAIVDPAGNVVDINSDTNVDATDETDDAVYAYLYAKTGSAARVTATTLETNKNDLIYKAKIVNGYIKRLTQLEQNGGSGVATDEYKEEFNKYGSVKFADSTVIFSVDATGATDVTADKVKVGAVADFFVDGERSGRITGYDKISGTLGAVIGFNLTETVSQEGAAVIISSVKTISYNDDEAVRINGLQAGKEVSFILYDEDKNYKAADFAKGEILLIGAADAEGVVANYNKLVKRTVTETAGVVTDDNYALSTYVTGLANGDVKENTTYHFGWIEETAGKTKFNDDKDAFFMNNGSSISLEMEKSANYTLVDFTESTSSPEISRKSAGTGIFGGNSADYESAAFVRIYDDETVEVVVYRWKNAYSPFSATAGTKTVTK